MYYVVMTWSMKYSFPSIIYNEEGLVTITPIGDAPTYVNGNLVLEPTILHHVRSYLF
jgi:hypothetical protein